MTTTTALLFRSIDRPELGPIDVSEIELCEECDDLTNAEYREAVERHGHHCQCCRGWRLVHGYRCQGWGYPVTLLED